MTFLVLTLQKYCAHFYLITSCIFNCDIWCVEFLSVLCACSDQVGI